MVMKRKESLLRKVRWEYSIERFSEVLNMHHHYSIFLLINIFPLKEYNNEETNLFHLSKVELPLDYEKKYL